MVADIADFERDFLRKFALDAEAPLQNVRSGQIRIKIGYVLAAPRAREQALLGNREHIGRDCWAELRRVGEYSGRNGILCQSKQAGVRRGGVAEERKSVLRVVLAERCADRSLAVFERIPGEAQERSEIVQIAMIERMSVVRALQRQQRVCCSSQVSGLEVRADRSRAE